MEHIYSPYQSFCEVDEEDSDYDMWEEYFYHLINLYHDEDLEAEKPINIKYYTEIYKEISRDTI